MELDCQNILQKTPSAPADAMRSAGLFELQLKVEVSRTLASTRTILKRIRKETTLKTLITFWTSLSVTAFSRKRILYDNNKFVKAIPHVNQMPVLDIELSDSQLLRNCNTVFTQLSEKSVFVKKA